MEAATNAREEAAVGAEVSMRGEVAPALAASPDVPIATEHASPPPPLDDVEPVDELPLDEVAGAFDWMDEPRKVVEEPPEPPSPLGTPIHCPHHGKTVYVARYDAGGPAYLSCGHVYHVSPALNRGEVR